MQNLQEELVELLQHEDSFVVEGQLNKTKIEALAFHRKYAISIFTIFRFQTRTVPKDSQPDS